MPAVKNYLSTSLEKDGIFKISDKTMQRKIELCALYSVMVKPRPILV